MTADPPSHRPSGRPLVAALLGLVALLATAAAPALAQSGTPIKASIEKRDLRVGFTPGPYEDAFKAGAAPVLGAQGYRIAYAHFSTGLEVNKAVAFADPEKIRRIEHTGEHFRMEGIHLVDPSPQRTPFLFQAGASKRGRDFAAVQAEAVFLSDPSKAAIAATVVDTRRRGAAAGEGPVVGPDRREAEADRHRLGPGGDRTEGEGEGERDGREDAAGEADGERTGRRRQRGEEPECEAGEETHRRHSAAWRAGARGARWTGLGSPRWSRRVRPS
ncbi:hypothetical protein [Methylobacterium indicum]|uniref:SsuA/THI5-like domain-containing protein n=1 Tax=Methylobacterium indicum TaxID=1775910 RepID=A0A8H8WT55_9HYPH|nr:hypothetical protein mvi_23180 [Methylobacterium indicum]